MADSATIGALRVSLGLDSAQFERGLKKASASANTAASGIGKGLGVAANDAGRAIGNLVERAGTVGRALAAMGGAGLAAGAALGGLAAAVGIARSAMAFGDDIADTAQKLAVTTDALQEYRFAVHALGGDYKDADAALEGFSKAFGAAHAQLSKKAAKPFEALGLDAKSFANTQDALDAVIKKIAALKSTAEQAAIADKLGLSDMLPAIRAGGDAIDDLRQKAHELGFVMDEDLVQRAGEANDKFEDLSHIIDVQLKSSFVDLAPAILAVTGAVADLANALARLGTAPANQAASRAMGRVVEAYRSGGVRGALAQIAAEKKYEKESLGKELPSNFGMSEDDPDAIRRGVISGTLSYAPPSGTSLNPVSGGGGGRGRRSRDASDQAIAAAARDELQARIALSRDIQEIGALKLKELDLETEADRQRLEQEVAEGRITKAAAAKAQALNDEAAKSKRALIIRETQEDFAKHQLEVQKDLAGYDEDLARIASKLAGTAAERAKIEEDSLAKKQAADLAELQARTDITDAEKAQLTAKLQAVQAAEREEKQREDAQAIQDEINAAKENDLQMQIDLLDSQQGLARTAYERRNIELEILERSYELAKLKLQEVIDSKTASDAEKKRARDQLQNLEKRHDLDRKQIERSVTLLDAMQDAADAAQDMAAAFRKGDIGGAVSSLSRVIEQVAGSLKAGGLQNKLFGLADSLGRIGQAATIGTTITSALGMKQGKGSGIGSLVGSSAAMLAGFGPIGMAVGAVLGSALGGLLGGKESNYGALATLNGTNFSLAGNKRTEQTSQLATAAAKAVLAGEQALKDAGIKLAATVKSIDIGTRDATDIILSDGRALTSAVGDAAAAAETGLKALLQGATYASEAQQKMVESALAAGASFDEIAQKLQEFAGAQGLKQEIADAILQILDPKEYDLTTTKRAQADRRGQVQAALDAGYLTAEQFGAINEQLTKLEGLEIDQVMKRYAASVDDATKAQQEAAKAALDAADAAVNQARDELSKAVEAVADGLQATIDKFSSLSKSLGDFQDSLKSENRSPSQQLSEARKAFAEVQARIAAGDTGAVEQAQGVGEALLQASKSLAPTQEAYGRDLAAVKKLTADAKALAEHQVSNAELQLQELHTQTDALLGINRTVKDVVSAIADLKAAIQAQAVARNVAAQLGVANDNFNAAGYLKQNPDVAAWAAALIGEGDTRSPEELARMHYDIFGKDEIAAGGRYPGFATGGGFRVGGMGGIDSKIAQMRLTPGEYVSVSREDPSASTAAGFARLESILDRSATYAKGTYDLLRRTTRDGDALVTTAA